jgi:hypothetical protein
MCVPATTEGHSTTPAWRARLPARRQSFYDVATGEHLLARLPPRSLRHNRLPVAKLERVRPALFLRKLGEVFVEMLDVRYPAVVDGIRQRAEQIVM